MLFGVTNFLLCVLEDNRPYSEMVAVLFFFCYCANEPTKPHNRARIIFNLAHANEAW